MDERGTSVQEGGAESLIRAGVNVSPKMVSSEGLVFDVWESELRGGGCGREVMWGVGRGASLFDIVRSGWRSKNELVI